MISAILTSQVITNQAELVTALEQQGVIVTQATLSRDLNDLHAEKKLMPNGLFKYVIPPPVVRPKDLGIETRLSQQAVVHIDFCGQFAVVKTRPAYASAVAREIDNRGAQLILGTIAGYDTVLVIPRESTTRDELLDFLYGIENL